ncbi:hypothetical protein [Devosia beringensis]|uniref:hypothetical protein n=1 Tax=Devosia beringensis TaxID=2657486 RepID=UPI00186B97F5|nr:hypothetical protein [Devosia beringensis]
MTPEEADDKAQQNAVAVAAFIESQTADFNAYVDSVRAKKALQKIADREARVAVEGDTDLNHDNVEGAPVDHYARNTADLDRSRVHLANCIMNCGTRIYEGDNFLVVPPSDEFYCAECSQAGAAA